MKLLITLSLLAFGGTFVSAQKIPSVYKPVKKEIYHKGWIDFNKNGVKDIYEDSSQPVEKRVENLLLQMNINEKTCQLATVYGYGRVLKDSLPTENWKNVISTLSDTMNAE